MQTEIASYPAYKIFQRIPNQDGVTEIDINDKLALKVKDYYTTFLPGSVASYALQYNDDPIEAVERAKAKGHELHWLINPGTMISNSKREQESRILIEVGMKIRFQGKIFEILPAPNHNLNLKAI